MALAEAVAVDMALRRVESRSRPVALARERVLPVPSALEHLFPDGGLRRGTAVAVDAAPGASGATALALALGGAASAAGSWTAVVGQPSLGLLAADELGLCLERLVVVDPPADQWATVVAALLDAVDLVYASLPRRVREGDARRLVARARERGSVFVPLGPGRWPLPADVRLTVATATWSGPCVGAGRLEARRVGVVSVGRGAGARGRRVALWLPGPDGGVACIDKEATPIEAVG